MTLSVTLADANILVSRTLRDYFVYAAKLGALTIHWSDAILAEVSRNLVAKYGFSDIDVQLLEFRLTAYLPQATVEVRKRDVNRVAKVDMDDKDRHVLAAALSARADVLLTDNTSHFPREWMAKRGIELLDSGTLLLRLATQHPEQLREAHRMAVDRSPKTETEVLATLQRIIGPEATDAVRVVVTTDPPMPSDEN